MNVYVARHGETDWNRAGRYQGQRESDLTETGRSQARAFADALRAQPIEAVFSSPLRRCRQSAEPLAQALGLGLQIDDRLIEIAHGPWEGHLRDEIEQTDSERLRAWREQPQTVTFPGGESLTVVRDRWRAFAATLSGYEQVAIVTHDVLVRLAILDATDRDVDRLWEPRVLNGAYARFDVDLGIWHLRDECIDAHLDGIRVETSAQAL